MNSESDHQWAMTRVGRAMTRLRDHWVAKGDGELFEALQAYLTRAPINGEYGKIAARFQMPHQAVAMTVSRLRQSFKELLCEELRRTLEDEK